MVYRCKIPFVALLFCVFQASFYILMNYDFSCVLLLETLEFETLHQWCTQKHLNSVSNSDTPDPLLISNIFAQVWHCLLVSTIMQILHADLCCLLTLHSLHPISLLHIFVPFLCSVECKLFTVHTLKLFTFLLSYASHKSQPPYAFLSILIPSSSFLLLIPSTYLKFGAVLLFTPCVLWILSLSSWKPCLRLMMIMYLDYFLWSFNNGYAFDLQ